MTYVFRTMIFPDAQRQRADDVSRHIYPDATPERQSIAGAGMLVARLSPTGNAPATHYISSGLIEQNYADMLPLAEWTWIDADPGDPPPGRWVRVRDEPGRPVDARSRAVANGMTITNAQMTAMFAAADITEQEPFIAMARLGLKMLAGEVDA